MGGGEDTHMSDPIIASVRIQTSAYGKCIPYVQGKTRIPGNLVWYSNFVATAHETSTTVGGKGGNGTTMYETHYTYSAAAIVALCEGEITRVDRVWAGKKEYYGPDSPDINGTPMDALGLTFFTGTATQNPFSFVTTNYPGEALGYRGLAYAAAGSYDLGSDASLPNHTFEVLGSLFLSEMKPDANPAQIIPDYLSDPVHGAGFPYAKIGSLTQYSNYCLATGLLLSPGYTSQEEAGVALQRIATATNSALVFSEGLLKVIPYGDQSANGNSTSYVPDNTPVYALTDDDFLSEGDDEPVIVKRKNPADCYNHVQVKFWNRSMAYAEEVAEAKDEANIDKYGLRTMAPVSLYEICDAEVARTVAQLLLQRALYIPNKYQFRLGWKYALVEPMDIVTLTESTGTGLNNVPVRITSVEEDEDGALTLEAEDFPGAIGSHIVYPSQESAGYMANYAQDPGDVNTPVIFDAPGRLTVTGYELWLAISGSGSGWGGCHIWASDDDVTYKRMGTVHGRSRHGVLTSSFASATDPDTSGSCAVDLTASLGELISGTADDADNLNTLCWCEGEMFSYQSATLTAANKYTLGTRLRRGAYATQISTHASGARFVRCDDAVFRYAYEARLTGKTIYFKFQSFNFYGASVQDISALTAYTHVIAGPIGAPALPSSAPAGALSRRAVFDVSGHHTFSIPEDSTGVIRIKAWGAGGQKGAGTGSYGGGGGFVQCDVTVTPGETLNVVTGLNGSGPVDDGGGADPFDSGAGMGGGFSGVFRGSRTQANALAIAPGGAGGGEVNGSAGGAGGGLTGESGVFVSGSSTPGTGGSQTAGGAYSGTALNGGDGGYFSSPSLAGGGGAGGYYGGGGGASAGGGGGSAWATGDNKVITAGSGTVCGNNTDSDYPGSGVVATGGITGVGKKGYVVIYY